MTDIRYCRIFIIAMEQTISITPKWQIHIPVEFRKKLGLTAPGLAKIWLIDKQIIIKPKASSLLELAGKYKNHKPKVKVDIDRIREKIDYSKL